MQMVTQLSTNNLPAGPLQLRFQLHMHCSRKIQVGCCQSSNRILITAAGDALELVLGRGIMPVTGSRTSLDSYVTPPHSRYDISKDVPATKEVE
jgi:hypothetical protein